MARPLVLITGATGAVGPIVVNAFQAAGYPIRTLSIDPAPAGVWPDTIETLVGDITDPTSVQAAMRGVDWVIHLAALLHIATPSPSLYSKYEQINVGGTSTVVEAAIQAGVRRIVFFSTISVYGESSHGRILTEDTPPCPDTLYARTKLEAEKVVLGAKDTDGRPVGVILRMASIYGAGLKGNYERLVQSLAQGRFIPVGDCSNRRTLVYEKDVADAAVLAASHASAAGGIFNVSDGTFHPMNELIGAMCSALSRRPPRFRLPRKPVCFAAGILEHCARLLSLSCPLTRDTIDKFTEDMAVDSRLIQQRLGFSPKYDISAGWKEAIAEMSRQGRLI